jgi:hypothetical protein
MRCSPRPILAFLWVCLLLHPSVGTAEDKDPVRLENVPTFPSTTNDPILLRYKMKAGQVEKIALDMDMNMRMRIAGEDIGMKMTMRMDAKAAVKEVDGEGNISALAKITRMTMKTAGPGMTVEFDSDKPSDNPDFKAVTAMINIGIPCKISPVGEMLETDLEPLRLAARRAGNAALSKQLEDSTKKMFDGTFIQLSKTPVKAGDTYKAGTIVDDKVKIHTSYKIRSVSGDKTKAVLEPIGKLELAPGAFPAGADVKIKEQSLTGWMLFDVQKGHMSKADMRMNIVLEINAMGQTGTVEITSKGLVTSIVE